MRIYRPFAELLGDLSVVNVRVELDDLLPLDVGEDHEGVHRPLDVVQLVLLCLQGKRENMSMSRKA